jgi:hypothetical protein
MSSSLDGIFSPFLSLPAAIRRAWPLDPAGGGAAAGAAAGFWCSQKSDIVVAGYVISHKNVVLSIARRIRRPRVFANDPRGSTLSTRLGHWRPSC